MLICKVGNFPLLCHVCCFILKELIVSLLLWLDGPGGRGAGDADETLVNGDDPDSANKRINIIMITGKAEDCEKAKKALLVGLQDQIVFPPSPLIKIVTSFVAPKNTELARTKLF